MDNMQQSAWLVVNPIKVYSYMASSLIAQRRVKPQNHDGPEVKLKSVGWCLMPVFGWAHHGST